MNQEIKIPETYTQESRVHVFFYKPLVFDYTQLSQQHFFLYPSCSLTSRSHCFSVFELVFPQNQRSLGFYLAHFQAGLARRFHELRLGVTATASGFQISDFGSLNREPARRVGVRRAISDFMITD